ncbi:MAG: MbnP family protein [Crocinitomicaceae bacterium]
MKQILLLASLSLSLWASAQINVNIDFRPRVNGNHLTLNTTVQDLTGVDMTIEFFNYYVSNVHIIHDGGQDLDLSDTVFIVTTDDHTLELGMLNVTNIESIDFGIGVPQSLNHEDITQYNEGHPLSWQTPSMHWGWTSGYKFLLVNGYGDSNNDGNTDAVFQIHSLGDANYKSVSMAVIPTVLPTATTIVIDCNLDEWMYNFDPGNDGVHHGEVGPNAAVMNNVDNRPVFTLPGNAGIDSPTETDGTITYSMNNELVTFNWKDVQNVEQFRLIDLSGRVIESGEATEFSGTHTTQVQRSGSYFFYLMDSNGSILKKMQVIN